MIRFLKNKGEKMPFKIGFYALREFQKEAGMSALTIERDLTMEEVEILFYFAYVNGCNAGKAEGWSVKHTRDDIVELLDFMFLDFIQLVPQLIGDYVDANTPDKKKSKPVTKKPAKKVQA